MSTDEQGTSFRFQEVPGSIPIVLVHGVGLDQTIWNRMLRDLTSYSTLTYDLLGHGDTILPLGAQSFEPFVGQLYSLLDAIGISEFVLVGFSLGGQVAKHFASMYPNRIKGLVFISTTYQRTTVERGNMASRVFQAKQGDQPSLETAALQRWFNPEFLVANPDIATYIIARLRNNDPVRFIESYELLSKAEDHSVEYSALTMPAIILTGDGDEGSTPFMAMEMARAMPNARAVIIQGAKHIGIIELHHQFSDALISFVSETVI